MATEIVLNDGALQALLQSEDGPVGADLVQRCLKVHALAVQKCPVDTGRLRSSLRWALAVDGRGLYGLVGSDVEYAGFVHDGTRYITAQPFLLEALEEAF